ncbi:MAG TPA: hypothetical protein VFD50_03415 [Thermoleophilia bacterium]|nr:hypothetical protein [Thermoleophilia bacterium]
MNEQRDEELGARLDELEVQEHGPSYWENVTAAAAPELEKLRTGASEDDAGLARPAGQAGSPARQSDRRRRFGRRRWLWIPVAAAVAAAAALVLLFGLPGGGSNGNAPITFGGPQPASAAEAIRFALGALDKAQAIKGTIYIGKVHGGVFKAGDKVTFLSARDGSCRVTTRTVGPGGLGLPMGYMQTTAYDAQTRRAEAVLDFGSKGMRYENTTQDPATGSKVATVKVYRYLYMQFPDAAPAPPESVFIEAQSFPLWQVRAYLRTMLGDPRVKFATGRIGGRPVWLLTTNEFSWGSHGQGSRGAPVTIAIDARTRMPLRISGYWGNGELRIDSAAYAARPPASAFVLHRPPAGQTHEQSEDLLGPPETFPGLPFDSAAAMKKAVDGMAAFPGWVPRGFALQVGASTVPSGSVELPPRFGTPPKFIPDIVVSLAYRRGFDAAYVTVRPDPRLDQKAYEGVPGTKKRVRVDTSDPFVTTVSPQDRPGLRAHTADVRLTAGAYAGSVAHIVVDPGYWPHLWVRKGPWVATVAGDLTRAEMVRIAESLAPWNPANGE